VATAIVSQHVCSAVHSLESNAKPHQSVYEIVTEQVIRQLEQGVAPWRKPWRTELPVNLISGKPYRGLNVFLLGSQGYGSRYWLTFNQTAKLGGNIRKGERASLVTFWHIGEERIARQTDGTKRKSKPFLLRFYRVFNVEQTEGIAGKLGLTGASPRVADLEQCEAIVSGMPNTPKREQSTRAWYRPSTDTVGMPSKSLFSSSEEYYSTLFHELTHSTGHASRVGREGIEQLNTFGSDSYSREELIAEMGSAMLCGVTGIAPRTIENSAAYLQSWIDRLRRDSKLLVSAASQAQKAADYIRGESAKDSPASEGEAHAS
jgi:antirestriction protein ArdC